jgi:hypothetical protein
VKQFRDQNNHVLIYPEVDIVVWSYKLYYVPRSWEDHANIFGLYELHFILIDRICNIEIPLNESMVKQIVMRGVSHKLEVHKIVTH